MRSLSDQAKINRTFLPGYHASQNVRGYQDSSTFSKNYVLGLGLWSKGRYLQALSFFLKVSQNPQDTDYLSACLRLLHMYRQGIGPSVDLIKAEGYERIITDNLVWFIKKASEGRASACFNLGLLCNYGYGVTQDDAQARLWYAQAALQGDPEAQRNLGFLYNLGYGGPRNYHQAGFWYEQAATQGDAEAQDNLGLLYELGHGVAQDNAMACFCYGQAAAQGYVNAQEALLKLQPIKGSLRF